MMMKKKNEPYVLFIVLSCVLAYYCVSLLENMNQETSLIFYAGTAIFTIEQLLILFVACAQKFDFAKSSRLDPLTGVLLENRMEDSVGKFLKTNACEDEEWAMIYLELSSFEHFNSLFGRETGDRLLQATGAFLRKNYFCAARCGGDCFAFLAKNSPDVETGLRKKLYDALGENPGSQYLNRLNVRLGICSMGGLCGRIPGDIFQAARIALKYAKEHPGTLSVVYDRRLQEYAQLEKYIEINMLYALSKEEFKVFVQPKYRISDNTCHSGEALVRWHSEERGMLMPDAFIPVLEKTGFIAEVDFFVLSFVFRSIRKALNEGREVRPVSVNQSRATIACPNYLQRLQSLVREYAGLMEYVELEVTESILESDFDMTLSLIRAVKEMGFAISLDDFGSGYSSLNVLRNLPVDTIKLDKEFLKETDCYEKNKVIIRNVVNMARELGLSVVCEGVETKEQFEYLRGIGCDYAQGYYCARPMAFAEYEDRYLKPHAKEQHAQENAGEEKPRPSNKTVEQAPPALPSHPLPWDMPERAYEPACQAVKMGKVDSPIPSSSIPSSSRFPIGRIWDDSFNGGR